MPSSRSRGRMFTSPTRQMAGPLLADTERASPDGPRPDWKAVEALLSALASSRTVFPTALESANWISSYEPGRRLRLESGERSSWVQVEHIRACWDTFERRRRISRGDVVEPGRRSAFMMALFEQLPGIERKGRENPQLSFTQAVRPRD